MIEPIAKMKVESVFPTGRDRPLHKGNRNSTHHSDHDVLDYC
jgi:hypothetical protein